MQLNQVKRTLTKEEAHARRVICSFTGLPFSLQHRLKPIPPPLSHLLFRKEEYGKGEADQWGNFEYSFADNTKRGRLWVPEVDLFAKEERERLKNEGVPLEPLWPKGYRFALVLTHDVDHLDMQEALPLLYRQGKRALQADDLEMPCRLTLLAKACAKAVLRKPKLCQDMTGTLQESLRIEKKLGVTSSYFFTVFPPSQISRFDCLYTMDDTVLFERKKRVLSDVVKEMRDAGFDIGLHGSYFSAMDKKLLIEQKNYLERHLQGSVQTARQHWLHFKMPVTPLNLAEAGIFADTTLGYNRNIGYRAGTGFPFHFFNYTSEEGIPLLEVPMIIQDGALIGQNALEYSPQSALSVVKRFIDSAENTEGCLTLLFHPDIFLKKGMSLLYEEIIVYALNRGGWVTDMNKMSHHWEKRCRWLEER